MICCYFCGYTFKPNKETAKLMSLQIFSWNTKYIFPCNIEKQIRSFSLKHKHQLSILIIPIISNKHLIYVQLYEYVIKFAKI